MILRDAHGSADPPVVDRRDEDVPAAFVRRRHERQSRAVRRPARVDVDGALRHDRAGGATREIEKPELNRVVAVRGVDDMPSIRRPVRLVVVSVAGGHLGRLNRADALPPERPLHGVNQLLSVW